MSDTRAEKALACLERFIEYGNPDEVTTALGQLRGLDRDLRADDPKRAFRRTAARVVKDLGPAAAAYERSKQKAAG